MLMAGSARPKPTIRHSRYFCGCQQAVLVGNGGTSQARTATALRAPIVVLIRRGAVFQHAFTPDVSFGLRRSTP
jgi:hypothetical protein